MTIAPLTKERFDEFVRLIPALADYERLPRPDAAAILRLRRHGFGPRRRFEAALALDAQGQAVGYAIWFETYSSLLARPVMYLDDLFVIEAARRTGAGGCSSSTCAGSASGAAAGGWTGRCSTGTPARAFYERRGGVWMKEWLLYRTTY